MSDSSDKLLEKIDTLIDKIELLTVVTVIGMQKEKLLKGKNKTEQIKTLIKLGLSNDAIALIVSSTPSTVSVRRSEIKRKKKKKAKQKTLQTKSGQNAK